MKKFRQHVPPAVFHGEKTAAEMLVAAYYYLKLAGSKPRSLASLRSSKLTALHNDWIPHDGSDIWSSWSCFQVIAFQRSKPETHQGEISLTFLTVFMVPPQMTWISSGVSITIVLPKPAPATSAPLNFDFGWVVPLDLDRPSWWNPPHRIFLPWKRPTWLSLEVEDGQT